jgi:hypothetical protein
VGPAAFDSDANLSGHAHPEGFRRPMTANAEILWILAEHLALTALPGVATALLAMRRGVRSVPVILALALAASGTIALLAFWAYYASPEVGRAWAFVVLLGSLAAVATTSLRGELDRGLLAELRTPLLLWALGCVFVVYLGFLHGGSDQAIGMSATRFSGQLPTDNDIPQFFAGWFYENGHNGTPPVYPGEWTSSDRPPLQVGYVLSQRIFGWDATGLHYQVLGVVLQQLWIVGLWALLLAARVGRTTRALAMITVLTSGVAIVNGFFVWPKLLPAAFLLAATALVATPLWSRVRKDWRLAVLVAALCTLAMLGHGSSVFGLVPLVAIAAFRGLPDRRWIAAAALTGVALMAPWVAYQSYGDPPGNRLVKWMIGGAVDVDDRGTLEAIVDGYETEGLDSTIHNKVDNLVLMTGGREVVDQAELAVASLDSGELGEAVRGVRGIFFFFLLPSLGLLLLAPLAMAAGRAIGRSHPSEWSFALTCFAILLVGAICWGLLLFGSEQSRPTIHLGSLLLPILGLCGAVAGLRSTFPSAGSCLLAGSAILTLALYVPSLAPPPGTSYSALAAVLASLGLAGFVVTAFAKDGPAARTNKLAA